MGGKKRGKKQKKATRQSARSDMSRDTPPVETPTLPDSEPAPESTAAPGSSTAEQTEALAECSIGGQDQETAGKDLVMQESPRIRNQGEEHAYQLGPGDNLGELAAKEGNEQATSTPPLLVGLSEGQEGGTARDTTGNNEDSQDWDDPEAQTWGQTQNRQQSSEVARLAHLLEEVEIELARDRSEKEALQRDVEEQSKGLFEKLERAESERDTAREERDTAREERDAARAQVRLRDRAIREQTTGGDEGTTNYLLDHIDDLQKQLQKLNKSKEENKSPGVNPATDRHDESEASDDQGTDNVVQEDIHDSSDDEEKQASDTDADANTPPKEKGPW